MTEEVDARVIEKDIDRIDGAEALMARLRERAAKASADYADMTKEGQMARPLAENKRLRAGLNAEMKAIKAEFDAAIRPYEDMIAQAKQELKGVMAEMKGAEALLKTVVDAQADEERDLRRQGLQATYEGYAGALADLVPFEKILRKEWLNKSYPAGKAAEEVEAEVDRLARDWDALKAQAGSMAFYETAETVFFDTLDLGKAMAANAELEAKSAKVAELQAVVDANRAAMEPEPQDMPPYEGEEAYVAEHAAEPEPMSAPETVRRTYMIFIDLSEGERLALMDYIKANNIGANRVIKSAVRCGR